MKLNLSKTHVATGYKGPIVYAFHELRDLAAANNVRFLYEATVMGGAPIFSLFREALPAARLERFRGILNSTTNLILTEMEHGNSFEAAVKKAQDLGIAETDPSFDVDGWDATVKVSALATVLTLAPAGRGGGGSYLPPPRPDPGVRFFAPGSSGILASAIQPCWLKAPFSFWVGPRSVVVPLGVFEDRLEAGPGEAMALAPTVQPFQHNPLGPVVERFQALLVANHPGVVVVPTEFGI